jgi:glycosyltransferase involved in cell wall biosynthesis
VVADVARELAIPAERITAVPHGISPVFSAQHRGEDAAARSRARLARSPYLLWVGSLHGPDPRKGLDLMFDAVESLEPSSRPLVGLVGKPGLGTRWAQERCKRSGIEAVLPGWVEDSELAALYRGAAAVVVPSRHEGFGLPALEAMACGAPLIVTDAGSLPSVVGEAAHVVRAGDVTALAEGLRSLLADPDLQARLRIAGRQHAASFSWEVSARRTVEVYERVHIAAV